MNPDTITRLGVYRLFWKTDDGADGGYSVASVGCDRAGRKWYAPSNWVTVPWFDWSRVDRVELIADGGSL